MVWTAIWLAVARLFGWFGNPLVADGGLLLIIILMGVGVAFLTAERRQA